ncbi:hypothetical protein COB55_04545 [Candidatus Wolfebacteria bacterium]|nr:MAG: hypothetical protein COB55_04545 [Candidatus Wolfebacteria bacterium]
MEQSKIFLFSSRGVNIGFKTSMGYIEDPLFITYLISGRNIESAWFQEVFLCKNPQSKMLDQGFKKMKLLLVQVSIL